MAENNVTGSCLCGAISYQITNNLGIFQYCHCSRCRKFTGSAFAPNILVKTKDFQWLKGESHVSRYTLAGAKYFATAFCNRCGSSMPWASQGSKVIIVPAGTLDSDPGIKPMQNIFCGSGASWYTEPDLLAKYQELPPKKG